MGKSRKSRNNDMLSQHPIIKVLDDVGHLNYENIINYDQIPEENLSTIIRQAITYMNGNGLPLNEFDNERLFFNIDNPNYKLDKYSTIEAQLIYGKDVEVRRIPKKERMFQPGQINWFEIYDKINKQQ